MDRRKFIASAVAAVSAGVVGAAPEPKRETLPEYLRRITPPDATYTEEFEVEMFCCTNNRREPLHYSLKMLKEEHPTHLNDFYWKTDKGPQRIDPSTLELLPFKPQSEKTVIIS
jgi:hypothetical protein